MKKFQGTGVAMVTPFLSDDSIDYMGIHKMVNHLVNGNIDFIVALGSTGEAATLNSDETLRVLGTITSANAGRIPIMVGCGGNNTKEVALKMELISKKIPFDAFMSVSPYYNKPSQNGIYEHYKYLSERSPKPILMYNVPGRTASNVLPETVLRIAEDFKNIIGIKEASGSIEQGIEIISNKPEHFLVTAGDDDIAIDCISKGYDGLISVIGNAYPFATSTFVRKALNAKMNEARNCFAEIAPFIPLIFREGNPSGIKELLKQMDLISSKVRLPLTGVSMELAQLIQDELNIAKDRS